MTWFCIHAPLLCLVPRQFHFDLALVGLVRHLITATSAVMIYIRAPVAQGRDAYGDDTTAEAAESSGKATC